MYSCFSGKFTVSVPGVYSVSLHVFGHGSTSHNAKLDLILNKADGGGATRVCAAHVQNVVFGAASCATLLELTTGDQLYAIGEQNGAVYAIATPFSSFQAHLLYKADILQ